MFIYFHRFSPTDYIAIYSAVAHVCHGREVRVPYLKSAAPRPKSLTQTRKGRPDLEEMMPFTHMTCTMSCITMR